MSDSSKFHPGIVNNLKYDAPAGLVVFLVALPLCLGIALASGAPLFAGIIAGIIGGIVIGFLSNSELSVSGPVAGLTAIVLLIITTLGAFENLLLVVIFAGLIALTRKSFLFNSLCADSLLLNYQRK